jgi:hypothetical protein
MSQYHPRIYIGDVAAKIHGFLSSALDGGERSASRSRRLCPQGKSLWFALNRKLGGIKIHYGHGG